MEVGVEISQKIRSAIKAKLMELGSYVDDELPDYIMVMVANKKTRAQMAGDLGLFLGTNTDVFTEWLSTLLVKLQAINTDSVKLDNDKEKKSKKKKDKSGEKPKKSKKEKSESTKSKKDRKKDKLSEPKKKRDEKTSDEVHETKKTDKDKESKTKNQDLKSEKSQVQSKTEEDLTTKVSRDTGPPTKTTEARNIKETPITTEDVEVEDVRQLLVSETATDALAEELEINTEAETVQVQAEESNRTVKVASSLPTSVNAAGSTQAQEKSQKSAVILKSGRRLSGSKSPSPERTIETSRKRKTPLSSVVGAKITSEDEEEYDPRNPLVGAVASVIKVSGRKSSIAPALQANRALLVKAMGEAERSIAVKRKSTISRRDARANIRASISSRAAASESYSPPKQGEVSGSPPPYIPTKKSRPTLSRRDARHVLDREEQNEQVLQARRKELLRSIGVGREDRKVVREEKSISKPRRPSEATFQKIQNFQITARVVSSPEHTIPAKVVVQKTQKQQKRKSDGGSASTKQEKVMKKAAAASAEEDNTQDPSEDEHSENENSRSFEADDESPPPPLSTSSEKKEIVKVTRTLKVKDKKALAKLDISSLAKELVKKQCKAAVKSVKDAQSADKAKALPDSRVVRQDSEEREKVVVKRVRSAERVRESADREEGREAVRRSRSEDRESVRSVHSRSSREEEGGQRRSRDQRRQSRDSPEDLSRLLDDSNTDFLDLEDDLTTLAQEPHGKSSARLSSRATKPDTGTRFIVTLDGGDAADHPQAKSGVPVPQAAVYAGLATLPQGHQMAEVTPLLAHAQGHMVHLPQGHLAQTQGQVPGYQRITPPKVQPFSISLQDSDDDTAAKMEPISLHGNQSVPGVPGVQGVPGVPGVPPYMLQPPTTQQLLDPNQGQPEPMEPLTALQRAKSAERCKFWPACAAGVQCEFHHPTLPCRTFPHCKFQDKCLFIHPNCRFDSKCTRPDCPFTHSSRRPPPPHLPAKPPAGFHRQPAAAYHQPYSQYPHSNPRQPLTCRFFPNCHNVNCTFYHPRPCRFGAACHNKANCSFVHPEVALPAKDKLTWKAEARVQVKGHVLTPEVTASQSGSFIPLAKLNYQEAVQGKVISEVTDKVTEVTSQQGGGVSSTSQ